MNSRIAGVFGGNLLFCQKWSGLFDKIKHFRSLFSAERATCAISTRPTFSALSQNLPISAILLNFPFSTTTHVLFSFIMTYKLGVPAEYVPCSARLFPLLVKIARHLSKTIIKLPSNADQHRPVNDGKLIVACRGSVCVQSTPCCREHAGVLLPYRRQSSTSVFTRKSLWPVGS